MRWKIKKPLYGGEEKVIIRFAYFPVKIIREELWVWLEKYEAHYWYAGNPVNCWEHHFNKSITKRQRANYVTP